MKSILQKSVCFISDVVPTVLVLTIQLVEKAGWALRHRLLRDLGKAVREATKEQKVGKNGARKNFTRPRGEDSILTMSDIRERMILGFVVHNYINFGPTPSYLKLLTPHSSQCILLCIRIALFDFERHVVKIQHSWLTVYMDTHF